MWGQCEDGRFVLFSSRLGRNVPLQLSERWLDKYRDGPLRQKQIITRPREEVLGYLQRSAEGNPSLSPYLQATIAILKMVVSSRREGEPGSGTSSITGRAARSLRTSVLVFEPFVLKRRARNHLPPLASILWRTHRESERGRNKGDTSAERL